METSGARVGSGGRARRAAAWGGLAAVLALTGCPSTGDGTDAGAVIASCSSGLTPGAACSFTTSCDEWWDFVDGGCGRIVTSCVDGRVVVDNMIHSCSLPDAGPDAPSSGPDAPKG